MDRETREYLDQKYIGLAGKEDLEKLRQEMKASFRQLKEEGKTQLLEWKQEITKALEESRKEWVAELGSVRETVLKDLLSSVQAARSNLAEFKAGQNDIQDQAKQLMTEVGTLNDKVRSGIVEVKDELGAMIKFSYADLERKLNALEARIQVLEKIVLQQA
jgi:gas vesicle protein